LPKPLPFFYFLAKRNERFEISAHIANARYSICDEKWKKEISAAVWFARASEMDVQIGEAGYQEFSASVNDSCSGGNGNRIRRAERHNFFLVDENRLIRRRLRAGHIDHGDVRDGDDGTLRLLASRKKDVRCEEKYEKCGEPFANQASLSY